MTATTRQGRSLSRGIDYLGDLGAKLRDLQGFATLAHELIQNADDTSATRWMSFDVGEHALVVDNDGTFSDCGQVEELECPWKHHPARATSAIFTGFVPSPVVTSVSGRGQRELLVSASSPCTRSPTSRADFGGPTLDPA